MKKTVSTLNKATVSDSAKRICFGRRKISSTPSVIEVASPGGLNVPAVTPCDSPRSNLIHHFDTFSIVTRLEQARFEHGQAVATMNAIRALLVNSTETAKAEMLSRADLENVCNDHSSDTFPFLNKLADFSPFSRPISFGLPCLNCGQRFR